jgi:hypothetical protein
MLCWFGAQVVVREYCRISKSNLADFVEMERMNNFLPRLRRASVRLAVARRNDAIGEFFDKMTLFAQAITRSDRR